MQHAILKYYIVAEGNPEPKPRWQDGELDSEAPVPWARRIVQSSWFRAPCLCFQCLQGLGMTRS